MAAVAQIEVPPAARALCALARVDYEDAFVVDVGPTIQLTAEQLVRRVADAAPDKLRGTLRSGWSSMGIQLDEAPPERSVLGWEIRRSTPDYVALGAACRIAMKGEMLFMRLPDQLLYCTFIELDDDDARAVWAGVEPHHPRLVRRLLESVSAPR